MSRPADRPQSIYVLRIEYSGTYGGEVLGTYASLDTACLAAETDARNRPRIMARAGKPVGLDWHDDPPVWSGTGLAGVMYRVVQYTLEP